MRNISLKLYNMLTLRASRNSKHRQNTQAVSQSGACHIKHLTSRQKASVQARLDQIKRIPGRKAILKKKKEEGSRYVNGCLPSRQANASSFITDYISVNFFPAWRWTIFPMAWRIQCLAFFFFQHTLLSYYWTMPYYNIWISCGKQCHIMPRNATLWNGMP